MDIDLPQRGRLALPFIRNILKEALILRKQLLESSKRNEIVSLSPKNSSNNTIDEIINDSDDSTSHGIQSLLIEKSFISTHSIREGDQESSRDEGNEAIDSSFQTEYTDTSFIAESTEFNHEGNYDMVSPIKALLSPSESQEYQGLGTEKEDDASISSSNKGGSIASTAIDGLFGSPIRSSAIGLTRTNTGIYMWEKADEGGQSVCHSSKVSLAFLDMSLNGIFIGRIVIKLFDDMLPLTTDNFKCLCTGEKGFGYKGSKIHRIEPNFVIQGGDFTKGDGTGGRSIYDNTNHGDLWGNFKDEGFPIKHDKEGIVSMANNGPNRNRSQFFITLAPKAKLDGKHVAFGLVTDGFNIVKKISTLDPSENSIIISDCGLLSQH